MILKDKVVLITGGSKGIGRAVAEAMAAEGASVVVNYAHDEVTAEAVVSTLAKQGRKAVAIKADITNQAAVDSMMVTIGQKFGSLDVLVNNAGIFDEDDSPDSLEAFRHVFDTNFLAQVRVTNAARAIMTRGKIIFTSSVHGQPGHGRPSAIAYSAMKAALNSYMKNLAKAVAPDILVNAVAPGRTLTPMWGEMDSDYRVKQASGHLIKRWIEPGEIASGIVFLAKNDAVCGEVLVIDGGMSLKTLG